MPAFVPKPTSASRNTAPRGGSADVGETGTKSERGGGVPAGAGARQDQEHHQEERRADLRGHQVRDARLPRVLPLVLECDEDATRRGT